eukprot:579002-Pyramimonas_sp.AAC.1
MIRVSGYERPKATGNAPDGVPGQPMMPHREPKTDHEDSPRRPRKPPRVPRRRPRGPQEGPEDGGRQSDMPN